MIIDLDSHLREGYFMDEVFSLPEPYARFTPQKAGEGRNHNTKWIHQLIRPVAAARIFTRQSACRLRP